MHVLSVPYLSIFAGFTVAANMAYRFILFSYPDEATYACLSVPRCSVCSPEGSKHLELLAAEIDHTCRTNPCSFMIEIVFYHDATEIGLCGPPECIQSSVLGLGTALLSVTVHCPT